MRTRAHGYGMGRSRASRTGWIVLLCTQYGAATRREQDVVATAGGGARRLGGTPDAHSGVEEARGCHNVTVSKSAGVAVVSGQRALWLSARSVALAFQGELPGGR